jgi:hypothetical protein
MSRAVEGHPGFADAVQDCFAGAHRPILAAAGSGVVGVTVQPVLAPLRPASTWSMGTGLCST